ncbi:hypothetical protein JQ604_24810 [Bradyrhizobium jicamae]|uniref:hypothetical protein n=1 Tax=Bradyrhizobium jicamae TaxID=280332 RepID=UPI001BABF59B|nr:hypothetical protein [Bradyrhizobium jicamae]MBR0755413.1 hypothetical protein [Bradyrhizobium jicamae]
MKALTSTLVVAAMLALPAAAVRAETDVLFPPATAGCYVGAEVTPITAGVAPYRKPAVPVTSVRLERSYPQLAHEEEQPPRADGGRMINLAVSVTFADAGKPGAVKRYSSGRWELLQCTADLCDAGNYKVEREAGGTVLLRMTGGMYVGGGPYLETAHRRLPDGHVYRLVASPMAACR